MNNGDIFYVKDHYDNAEDFLYIEKKIDHEVEQKHGGETSSFFNPGLLEIQTTEDKQVSVNVKNISSVEITDEEEF